MIKSVFTELPICFPINKIIDKDLFFFYEDGSTDLPPPPQFLPILYTGKTPIEDTKHNIYRLYRLFFVNSSM